MAAELAPPTAAASTAVLTMPGIPGYFDPFTAMALGSIVGACIAIGLTRTKDSLAADAARIEQHFFLKFGASLGSGLVCTPIACRWMGFPFEAIYLGPVSLLVAAVSVNILHRVLPKIEGTISRRAERVLEKDTQ